MTPRDSRATGEEAVSTAAWPVEDGAAVLRYQHCPACRAIWYFQRGFCPRCGQAPSSAVASGRGTVYAVTVVSRAPTEALAAYTPYAVLLVDAAEGFRLMTHGDRTLAIGDPVHVGFHPFGDALLPYATRTPDVEQP